MLISLSGEMSAGKDEVAKLIQQTRPWTVKKWAGKLKECASIILGVPLESWESQEFKKQLLPPMWNKWQIITDIDTLFFNSEKEMNEYIYNTGIMYKAKGYLPITNRQFLQLLGTDGVRNGLHTNVWVNSLMQEYEDQTWIITDTRFDNERDAIVERKGILVKVVRFPESRSVHSSEVDWKLWDFDYVINNTKDLNHLKLEVENFLKFYNL